VQFVIFVYCGLEVPEMKRIMILIVASVLMMAEPLFGARIESIDISKGTISLYLTADEPQTYMANSPIILSTPDGKLRINAIISGQENGKLVLSSRDDFAMLNYYKEVRLTPAMMGAPHMMGIAGYQGGSQGSSSGAMKRKRHDWQVIVGMGRRWIEYSLAPQYEVSASLQYRFKWPINLGPRVSYQMADSSALPNGSSQNNVLMGVEMVSWNPRMRFGPYMGLRYDLMSQGAATVVKNEDGERTSQNYVYDTLGWSYFGGLVYRFNTLFTFMGGLDIGDHMTCFKPNELFYPAGANSQSCKKGGYNYRSKAITLSTLLIL
jgi:hypothetical protein